MGFRNIQVEAGELPDADRIEFEPLAPAYPREVLCQGLLTWVPIFLVASVPALLVMTPLADKLVSKLPAIRIVLGLLAAALLLVGALLVTLGIWRARLAGFALREHDIAHRYGLLFRKVVLLPFERVQHAEVSVGPLQRRFGLASLKLYTAGASGVDLRIDGLTAAQAGSLRDHVIRRVRGAGDG